MIPTNIFFKLLSVPDFLKEEFFKDDWYKLPGRLKEILKNNLKNSTLKSTNTNLLTHGIVYIGKNCVIGDYVVIDGPAYIGDNTEISSHVYIRPGSVIGNGCSIGHAAEIKTSVIMDGAKIANHAFVGDSIVGNSGRVGGHSETQNRKFEQDEIILEFGKDKYPTGLDKYGAIIGEGSRLGGGVFTAPGTLVGMNSFISSGIRAAGFIPSDSFLKNKISYEIKKNRSNKKLNNNSTYIER